jgi:DNA-binding NarL/FixJ family response regulator
MQESVKMPRVYQPKGRSLRVFLVEDFGPLRELIAENLEEIDGLQLAGVAESEEGALAWLHEHACDILILDLELRQGNGLGVLKALAGRRVAQHMEKIVYSNHASANIRRLASQFGATHFFDKTLDTPKLRQLLEQLSSSSD